MIDKRMASVHRIVWISLVAVAWIGVLCLRSITPVVKAAKQYQTVPTMPPPTATPTSTPHFTPTNVSQPTATRPQPTATHPKLTAIAPTQTEQVAATETALAIASSQPVLPSATWVSGGETTPTVMAITSPTIIVQETSTTSQVPLPAARSNVEFYFLFCGGVLLVVLILLGVWLRRRKYRPTKNDGNIP